ncbi:MAG: ABC transporter substrate-binding protein [Bauldia sp.]|nr:ABC transporter substrate-binding protein [Bauldia sp.]
MSPYPIRRHVDLGDLASARRSPLSAKNVVGSLAGLIVSILVVTSPALAQDDPAVSDFILRLNRAVYSLAGKAGAAAETACRDLNRSLLDVNFMAQRAAADAWNRMTGPQKTRYLRTVEGWAARECVLQNRNNSGAPVVFLGLRPASEGDRLLATRVEQKDSGPRTVVWRLGPGGPPLRARDILLDGRSAAITLRREVGEILGHTNGDIDTLIATLDRR